MADLLGELEVKIRAALDQLDKDLNKAKSKSDSTVKEIGDKVEKTLGDKLSGIGKTLTKTLTPVAAAVGVTTLAISSSWNKMNKEMAVQTGATGDRLKELTNSVRNVAGSVKGSVGEIGDVISDLAAKTKLTGKPLEDLTRKILSLKELGAEVSGTQVASVFGQWNISADKMGDALDRLFKVSQVTATPVATLLTRLGEFRPVLQGMGFSFDQATLLVSRLTDAMVPGLRKALNEIAASGKDPKQAFDALVASIHDAVTESDAMVIGLQAFGPKAAAPLVQAIRAGKFSLDDLSNSIANNANTIEGTADKYRTLGDRLDMLKDKAFAFIGPFASQVAVFANIAAGIGPVLQGLGALSTKADEGGRAAQVLVVGLKGLAAAGAVAGTLFAIKQGLDALGLSADSMNEKARAAFANLGRASDQELRRVASQIAELGGNMRNVVMKDFLPAFDELARSAPASAQRVIDAFKAQGMATGEMEAKLRSAIAGTQQHNRDQQTSADIIQGSVIPSQQNLAAQLEETKAAMDAYDQALKDIFGSLLGVQEADLQVAEAEGRLTDMRVEGTLETGLNTDAQRGATQAALSLITAIENQTKRKEEDAVATHTAYNRHGDLIAQLEAEREKYPELQGVLDAYIGRLRGLDGMNVNSTVTTTYVDVYASVHKDIYGTGAYGPGYASGGVDDFGTGTLTMLHGREAILPLDDMRRTEEILKEAGVLAPTDRIGSLGGGDAGPGGGGPTYIIQGNALFDRELESRVRRQLDNVDRHNGSIGARGGR